ncbi:hypothetical protein DH2020_040187 [Rehmannia glutinosa]|uniref:Uncharacterized protein n=1 Tax=Rehmannia glutinosa TaxID=99300 RepID=A0ABR0UUF6_REHGL
MEFPYEDGRYMHVQRPKYDCLLFDYMIEKLGIEESKIPELCNLLYKNYGTTMAGLRAIGYDFDYDEYHSYVHGRLPYENLKPDPVLRSLLLSLPIRKVIFTNAVKIHAVKVLSRLGSSGLPKTPIVCKPSESAIETALKIANIDPYRTLFFEDSVRNIQSGKRVGLDTVLVGKSQRVKGADYALESIHNLREAISELWEADNKLSEANYTGVAVETSVIA